MNTLTVIAHTLEWARCYMEFTNTDELRERQRQRMIDAVDEATEIDARNEGRVLDGAELVRFDALLAEAANLDGQIKASVTTDR